MACVQLNVFWDTVFLRYFLPGSSAVAHLAVVEYGEYLVKVNTSYVIAYVKHASISLKVPWTAQNCTFPVAQHHGLNYCLKGCCKVLLGNIFRWMYSSMWKAQSETKYYVDFS